MSSFFKFENPPPAPPTPPVFRVVLEPTETSGQRLFKRSVCYFNIMTYHNEINIYNFALGTEISCDTSYQEQYNPKNLTSSDFLLKKKGFLVDYFIRPPISVELKFENSLWISHVNFQPRVGQQTTKGFEIYINDSIKVSRHFLNNPETNEVICQNFSFPGNKFQKEIDQFKVRLGSTEDLKEVKSLTIKIFSTLNSTGPTKISVFI